MKKFIGKLLYILFWIIVGFILGAFYIQHVNALVTYPPAALLQPGDITGTMIRDGTITNADVSSTAAITYSKLNLTGKIVDADVSSTAAISADKLTDGTTNKLVSGSAQTWDGVKTFTSIPQIPTSTPTGDNGVISLGYLNTTGFNKFTVTAGERIDAYNAVMMGNNSSSTTLNTLGTGSTDIIMYAGGTAACAAQTLSPGDISLDKTNQIVLKLAKTGLPTGNAIISLATSTTVVASSTLNVATLTTATTTYVIPITMTSSTAFNRIYVDATGIGDASNYIKWTRATPSTYAGGNVKYGADCTVATDSATEDFGTTLGLYVSAGSAYQTRAGATSSWMAKTIGFATGSINASSTGSVQLNSAITNTGWNLSPGETYYLANTAGTISTTPGGNTKTVGIGLATTTLGIYISP